jgi:protein-S-isoprenylcysteine O-methyltransferase Ste14
VEPAHYLILAIPGEESSFVAALGDRYRECPRRVDWRVIPKIWLRAALGLAQRY